MKLSDKELWIERGREMTLDRDRRLERARHWKFDTLAAHGLYHMSEAFGSHSGSIMEPVYLTPAQAYHDSGELEAALSYQMPTWCYSRIANPSTAFLEETIALLEGYGTRVPCSGLATSSGMSAIRTATDPFLVREKNLRHPNIVVSARVYGGTFQQFQVRRAEEEGVEVRWVLDPLNLEEWAEKIDEETRFVYGEFPSNPSVSIFDIEAVAELAHDHGIPLIVDSTCASPALTRPIQFGADIVIHSASKVIGSSGTSIVGLIVARKDLPSRVGSAEMRADFAVWAKLWPYRDNGPSLHPMAAILTLNDMRTLRMRVAQMSRTAQTVAKWLESHPQVARVHYPGLKSHPAHELARKYLRLVDDDEPLFGFMLAVEIAEEDFVGIPNTRGFYDGLEMIWRATDLGRVKTVATLNAISTHQQQGEVGRSLASLRPNTVRLSIGIEDPGDIIRDLERGFANLAAVDPSVPQRANPADREPAFSYMI